MAGILQKFFFECIILNEYFGILIYSNLIKF